MEPNRSLAYFYEKQRFDQIWLISLMVTITIMPIAVNIAFFVLPYEKFDALSKYLILIDELIYLIIMGTFSFTLLFIFKLETFVMSDGLYFRLYPINITFIHYKAHDINGYKTIEYDPISEFGGWGIRYGNDKKAYTTSGKIGIELEIKNKKNIVIGTKKPDAFNKALKIILT